MNIKHKPATALPWETSVNAARQFDVCAAGGGDMVADLAGMPKTGEQDAAYIAHAANKYPKLVKALDDVLGSTEDEGGIEDMDLDGIRTLLRECGEYS